MKYTKKIYIFGLVAVLALVGCSDDALIDSPDFIGSGEYVSFAAGVSTGGALASRSADTPYEPYDPLVLDTDQSEFPVYLHTYEHAIGSEYVDRQPQSRGEQVNDVNDFYRLHQSFGVDALKADGSAYFPMQNTRELTDDHIYWTTNGMIPWPRTERLQFHAIAPYTHLSEVNNPAYTDKKIEFSYTAKKSASGDKDAEAQTDLLMAVASMTLEQAAEYDYHVPLKFNHALSAIKFAVRDIIAGRVVSIAIKGVKGSGKCTYTAAFDSEGGQFVWDTEGVAATSEFNQIFDYTLNSDFPFETVDPNSPAAEDYDIVLTDDMPAKTFMMIPQVIPADARIELTIEQILSDGTTRTITVGGKIGNNVKEWLPGHEYIYTISTSKDNWIYVFEAIGNEAHGYDDIYVYSPANVRFTGDRDNNIIGLGNNAYFSVRSYRYRANNQTYTENLPWTAEHDGSYSYQVKNEDDSNEKLYPESDPESRKVSADTWITDLSANQLKGDGSISPERHNLSFLPHFVSTNWKGDEVMQGYQPFENEVSLFNENSPYDLSTFGGTRNRTTANCYVVDRGGWYMLPLVYGNAIKNGQTNSSAYTTQSNATQTNWTYRGTTYTLGSGVLKTLVDYNNEPITQPEITNVPNNCSAMLLWQDAYNMIDVVDIFPINGQKMLRFHVARENLQQGNAIVALLDQEGGTVIWSWHIWATEHWLNPNTHLPHVYENSQYFNQFVANDVTGIREHGDVAVTYNQGNKGPFYMAPYNLGWCDPKSVIYLKRTNTMDFVQKLPDGTPTGKTAQLPIIQDGITIDYKHSNNTYYQWGRKDPMRGFFNLESQTKVVFGDRLPYIGQQGSITIGESVQNPDVFYGKSGSNMTDLEDWLVNQGYINLWNNHVSVSGLRDYSSDVQPTSSTYDSFWSHTKTVYDPSPAGYMVPNAGVFHVVNKDSSISWYGTTYTLADFQTRLNGKYVDDYTYKVWGNGIENDNNALFFTATGNRWWGGSAFNPGTNQANTVSIAWSNRYCNGRNDVTWQREAFGLALGLDGSSYRISAQFLGRRAMGRPVRAIREP